VSQQERVWGPLWVWPVRERGVISSKVLLERKLLQALPKGRLAT